MRNPKVFIQCLKTQCNLGTPPKKLGQNNRGYFVGKILGQTKTFQNFFQKLLIESVRLLEVDIKEPTMIFKIR